MYELILVPLDGSKRAEAIIPHVEALGGCLQSKILLMQVIEPVLLPYDPQGVLPELDTERTDERRKIAQSYLTSLAEKFNQSGMEVQVRIEAGAVVETILEVAQTEKVHLIALASHGRTGLARAFYGSVADGILHNTKCPLLVVRSI